MQGGNMKIMKRKIRKCRLLVDDVMKTGINLLIFQRNFLPLSSIIVCKFITD